MSCFYFFYVFTNLLPTLRLLGASVSVALSGGLRLHIAFLFAGIPARIPVYCATVLIIYATYTIDRAMGSEEDVVNKIELAGSNRIVGLTLALLMFLMGFFVFANKGIFAAAFIPSVIGALYSRSFIFKGCRFSLKGGGGIKNLVIGLTWGGTMAVIVGNYSGAIPGIAILMFYGIKLFCNSVIYDMKDIRGDLGAGIITIPAQHGICKAKKMILAINLSIHSIMVILLLSGILYPEWALLAYSFFSLLTLITFYSPEREVAGCSIDKYARIFLVDGESITALLIRTLVHL